MLAAISKTAPMASLCQIVVVLVLVLILSLFAKSGEEDDAERVRIESDRFDFDGFYDIPHVARRIPQRIEWLRLANPIARLNFQNDGASPFWNELDLPFAKGIFAQVLAQLRFAPALAAIVREETDRKSTR